MNIFNPEHDLCMANGDANFVPPASALEFGNDCAGLTEWIEASSDNEVIPWGWDAVLKRRLRKSGIREDILPPDSVIAAIRELSHRKIALQGCHFVNDYVHRDYPQFDCFLRDADDVKELYDISGVIGAVNIYGDAVLKAPWSGSGKGLRWARAGELSTNDLGWCDNVISKQGSVMAEKRCDIVRDFAMLFRIEESEVVFEGYSLFFNDNGIYKGNVLASDNFIISELSRYVPEELLWMVRAALAEYLLKTFVGKYHGFVGVDMFIFRKDGKFCLASCVEINVRMTMGLLARRVFDEHLTQLLGLANPCQNEDIDGRHVMVVEYFPHRGDLYASMSDVEACLTSVSAESRYAVWIKMINI